MKYIKTFESFKNPDYLRNKNYYDQKFNTTLNIINNLKYGDIIEESVVYEYVEYLTISGSQSHSYDESFIDGDLGKRIEKYPYYKYVEIPINEINYEEFYYNDDVVSEYSSDYLNIKKYPPIVLCSKSKGSYRIIDGTHRCNALIEAGIKNVNSLIGIKKR